MIRPRRRRRERERFAGADDIAAALDAAPVMVRTSSADPGECTWSNRAWLDFRGQAIVDELGTGWARAVHADDERRLLDGYRRAQSARAPYETEYRLRRANGDYRSVLERGRPRVAADGTLLGYVITVDDVSERREARADLQERSRQRAAIADLGRAALAGRDFRDLAADATQLVTDALGAQHVVVFEHTPDKGLVPVAERNLRRQLRIPGAQDAETSALARAAFDGAETVVVNDWAEDRGRTLGELFRMQKIRSSACAPIRSPSGPVGVLVAHDQRRGAFTEDQLNFLRNVANQLGAALTRQRVEEELRSSAARLRLALDVGRMGTWEWDPATNEVAWSPELEQLFGAVPGTFEGNFDAFVERVHPDDREHVLSVIRDAVENDRQIGLEHRLLYPDGSIRWIEGRGSRVSDADPVHWIGVGIDIHDRKMAEEERERLLELEQRTRRALEENIARLDTLLENSPFAFAFFDDEFRVVRLNAQVESITGRPAQECMGHTMAEFAPELWAQLEPSFKEVFATQRAIAGLELSGVQPGTPWFERHFLVSCYPVQAASGEILGVGAVFNDITTRKREELAAHLVGRASALFAHAHDVDATVNEAARLVVPDFADLCSLYFFATPTSPQRVTIAHVDDEARERLIDVEQRWPLDLSKSAAVADAVATGRAQRLEISPEVRRRFAHDDEHLRVMNKYGGISVIAAPLQARGEVLGLLVLNYTRASGRRYRRGDVAIAEELARRIAQAIDSAHLAMETRRAQERLDLLARAGEVVVVELDAHSRMAKFVELMVPDFADLCVLHLRDGDGRLRHEHFALADPAMEEPFVTLERWPSLPNEPMSPNERACATRKPILVRELRMDQVPRDHLDALGADREAAMRRLNVSSLLVTPLLDDGEAFGTLTFAYGSSERHYTREDVPLAEELARRAAASFQHAVRYERERATAETLQRSLLPQRVPTLPGLTSTARYLPGGESERVGGDWYDVFALPDGTVFLAIGDVVGHGLPAASSTGLLRAAGQLSALERLGPSAILDQLNGWLLASPDADMATVAVVRYEPAKNKLSFASAGHPPPLRVRRDGKASFLQGALAPPLRVGRDTKYRQRSIRLREGELLVLYTDGLIERRGESLDVGLARLRDAVLDAPPGLEAFADHLLARTLPDEGPADDVALLVVRAVAIEGPPAMEDPVAAAGRRRRPGLRARLAARRTRRARARLAARRRRRASAS